MYALIDSGVTPPCGWTYLIPETGLEVEGHDLGDLLARVRKNLELNQFPYLNSIVYPAVMKSLCERSPSGTCRNFVNLMFARSRDVMNGTIALSVMVSRGKGAFVSSSVAEERALICRDCVFNIDNPGCISCKGFGVVIKKSKRNRATIHDSDLNTCGICKCFLEVLVHVSIGVLRLTTTRKQLKSYPAYCWKKIELQTGE